MTPFMSKDFLLYSNTAKDLYHNIAAALPIYDYHCHLDPKEIYQDKSYQNITQLWLAGDHYKWRLMRLCGIDESLITGNADDRDKFYAFASIMPDIIGNPIYHWAHLELQRYFNIYEPLNAKTASSIYDNIELQLKSGNFTARKLIVSSNVKTVCTTDDPKDVLEYHVAIKEQGTFPVKILPTFRPDKSINITANEFTQYITSLDPSIADVTSLLSVLYARADFFAWVGCKLSDHAFLDVPYVACDLAYADSIFKKRMYGNSISQQEADAYATFIFTKLCEKYHALGWAVQIHIGALRNNNTSMFNKLGADTGYDSVHDGSTAKNLSRMLDGLAIQNKLPKTILYSLNPNLNYALSAMLGNFAGEVRGKMQFGSAWWFADQFEGMNRHIKDLASLGALGTFIGMLTDSRSFLSYPRHEYFRRILCNIVGEWVDSGQYPSDTEALSQLIRGICCDNVVEYLGL